MNRPAVAQILKRAYKERRPIMFTQDAFDELFENLLEFETLCKEFYLEYGLRPEPYYDYYIIARGKRLEIPRHCISFPSDDVVWVDEYENLSL